MLGGGPDRPLYYLACQVCKKKVSDEQNGYRCENCQKTFQDAVPSYNFTMIIADHSNEEYIQCIGEVGDHIMGCPAIVISELMAEGEAAIKAHIHSCLFKTVTLVIRSNLD